ncbi:MAG: HD domain-containing protein [Gudongella sp.]|nr:HD domain-containing protein [Gudongella sp.]
MINKDLLRYIELNIIPRYNKNDKAHNENHVRCVIRNSMLIAENYDVNKNIIYTAAAYHDLGLEVERERHEIFSKEIMLNDKKLDEFFNKEEKEVIADAILAHRASSKLEPTSIYGKIIADADRDLVPVHIIERTILYSLDKFPQYDKKDHFIRSREHIKSKYGKESYMKLWLDLKVNNERLEKLRNLISDESRFKRVFDYYFEKNTKQYDL